jgi:hypothetical protein
LEGQQTVERLSVVNDRAEKEVALIKEYNQILTKDGQKQDLLEALFEHRKRILTKRSQWSQE